MDIKYIYKKTSSTVVLINRAILHLSNNIYETYVTIRIVHVHSLYEEMKFHLLNSIN